jgi:hypothetical protein
VCAPGTVGTMVPIDQTDKLMGFIEAQESYVQV